MKITREDILRVVGQYVQPLYRGSVETVTGLTAKLTQIIPYGTADNFQFSMPFGLISAPVKGVVGFIQNLYGSPNSPVILGIMDPKRPKPSAPGEVIVYCTDSSGAQHPIKITLKNDGTLMIEATTKVQIKCDEVELGQGTLEKVLNGEATRTWLNSHTHIGNLGAPTTGAIVPLPSSALSNKVKAAT